MKHHYDVIVVGGGHAGCEAAAASARAGAETALITLKFDGIGQMSCNPAIGGLGKGHLVREIDAMDGVMGQVADMAGIQFRMLNRRKGPAVQGPRAQMDRALYRQAMQNTISKTANLATLEGEVVDINYANGKLEGVILADGTVLTAKAVVLTTGTFLRGIIRLGQKATPAGRVGDPSAVRLAERLDDLGFPLGRLKTGTPPRLDSRTINWEILEEQPGDYKPEMFSFLSSKPHARQISCAITHTNARTHDIIRRDLDKSAIYGGYFESTGPRYCPSIEDKVVRFAERESHQIFLEPEGLTTDLVYPNGISTSLPEETQEEFVKSIRGLEQARITQFGYAIEYDYVDPKSLRYTLETRNLENLFLAGQINGTTGYEEAAGQGLVAGLNAARKALGKENVQFLRSESYIGVMIDDLITRGVTEPYRMFTSRAEFRLSLRADNADQRLTPKGIELGVISAERKKRFGEKLQALEYYRDVLTKKSLSPTEAMDHGIVISKDGIRRTGLDLLTYPEVNLSRLAEFWPELKEIDQQTTILLENDSVYSRYLERQNQEAKSLNEDERCRIPDEIDYMSMKGLSGELRSKLDSIRPETLGQAGRIEGMTPSALAYILSTVNRKTSFSQARQ